MRFLNKLDTIVELIGPRGRGRAAHQLRVGLALWVLVPIGGLSYLGTATAGVPVIGAIILSIAPVILTIVVWAFLGCSLVGMLWINRKLRDAPTRTLWSVERATLVGGLIGAVFGAMLDAAIILAYLIGP